MEYLFYVRLIGFTAGTLLFLFLLVMLAGLRRPRLFESLLFFTGISLFLSYAGGLLAMNAEIHYGSPPPPTMSFAVGLMVIGMGVLPILLVHGSFAYLQRLRDLKLPRGLAAFVVTLLYVPLPMIGLAASAILATPSLSILDPVSPWSGVYSACLGVALFVCAAFHRYFARNVADASQSRLHISLAWQFAAIGALAMVTYTVLPFSPVPYSVTQALASVVVLTPLVPGSQLGYFFVRQRILPAGVQRNLIFTVTAGFLALLYLTVARRASVWLEPFLPPEATVSILLFVLVVFFEPLQRRVGNVLERAFRAEAGQLQRLIAEIQQVARAGDLQQLISFAETRIRDSFSLSGVRISLKDGPQRPARLSGNVQRFILRNGPDEIGVLEACFFGQTLSGETFAALDYLAEQLPAAMDLCLLLDDKLRLERELAERERLALLGQMAASISHNLRNPLGSIKTLLQLQLENPELPASAREDCQTVVGEVDRLNAKLTQLLRYAKPLVPAAEMKDRGQVDAAAVAADVVTLLQHEAERRQVSLSLEIDDGEAHRKHFVVGSGEALSDVLSNLILNALEAVPVGGAVHVRLAWQGTPFSSDTPGILAEDLDRIWAGTLTLQVTDNGPGIPAEIRQRIFQPFFSTKPSGTGLGLAIVEKRLAEMGGTIECESPVRDARGTRFTVTLLAASEPP